MESTRALWAFDLKQHTWEHKQTTGNLPTPPLCIGLAVVGHHAYVLVNHHGAHAPDRPYEPDTMQHMEVYMLDLTTWHWTHLPPQRDAPMCAVHTSPTVVQVGQQSSC